MAFCQMCSRHIPTRVRIEGRVHNLKNRKYCLECSPFGKHNTKRLKDIPPDHQDDKRCSACGIWRKRTEFYRRRGEQLSAYCKVCTNVQTVKRQQRLKQQIVAFLGGCCSLCGYDRYIGSLELHHQDPTKKDFDFAHCRTTNFEKVKPELEKCILLCANCHREEHARMKGLL
jgi:hypothetical protein